VTRKKQNLKGKKGKKSSLVDGERPLEKPPDWAAAESGAWKKTWARCKIRRRRRGNGGRVPRVRKTRRTEAAVALNQAVRTRGRGPPRGGGGRAKNGAHSNPKLALRKGQGVGPAKGFVMGLCGMNQY